MEFEKENIRPVCEHNPAIDCPCKKYVRATENAVSAWRIIAYMVTCLNA